MDISLNTTITETVHLTPIAQALTDARALITPVAQWTQGELALNNDGHAVNSKDKTAICWCAAGSIRKVSNTDYEFTASFNFLKVYILTGAQYIADYNDNHTHTEILQLFDTAIAAAKELGV